MAHDWFEFPDRDALAAALGARIGERLAEAIDARKQASLVVSGGRTPVRLGRRTGSRQQRWADPP